MLCQLQKADSFPIVLHHFSAQRNSKWSQGACLAASTGQRFLPKGADLKASDFSLDLRRQASPGSFITLPHAASA